MPSKGVELHNAADEQISELTRLLSTRSDAALRLPCPGREELGDGTVGAVALHTADSYLRIAEFLRAAVHGEAVHVQSRHGSYAANPVARARLLERLSAASSALAPLADLGDEQLETVPPASDMKFCDGTRTLEQIVRSLLKHQDHHVHAMKAAVA